MKQPPIQTPSTFETSTDHVISMVLNVAVTGPRIVSRKLKHQSAKDYSDADADAEAYAYANTDADTDAHDDADADDDSETYAYVYTDTHDDADAESGSR